MTDTDKIRAIHDWIVLNCKYDYDNYLNNTIPRSSFGINGILLYQTAVCEGYAHTFKFFMDIMNIPCTVCTSSNHAWNKVYCDGQWYYIDVIWEDPVPDNPGTVKYKYFLSTTLWGDVNHILDKEFQTIDYESDVSAIN